MPSRSAWRRCAGRTRSTEEIRARSRPSFSSQVTSTFASGCSWPAKRLCLARAPRATPRFLPCSRVRKVTIRSRSWRSKTSRIRASAVKRRMRGRGGCLPGGAMLARVGHWPSPGTDRGHRSGRRVLSPDILSRIQESTRRRNVAAMPSMDHETLVDLFKNRPSLAAELLGEALGVSLPSYTEARLASTDLTEIQPAEYRADLVVVHLDRDIPVRGIIVEVQLAADPRKRLSWPAYVTVSRAIHGCPADLLVVAPELAVAGWCAEPIEIGVPGFVLRPPVLRRTAVPVVTDLEEAARRPELGVLSAMAHGETEQGTTIAATVLPAIRGLDDDRARLYYDLVYNSLNEAARRALEAMMKGYEYQSDFAKKYVAEGRTEGRAEGRAEEAARALLTVLRVRGIAVPDAVRERIVAQKDPERLERWLERAAVAASVTAVIAEPS